MADSAEEPEILVHVDSDSESVNRIPDGLESWLETLVAQVAPDATGFGVKLIDDDEMIALSLRYRNRETTTDVLSFPAEEGFPGDDNRYLGDVAISLPVASRQAAANALSLGVELQYLMIHGLLHCLGYDHETDDGEMEAVEWELRSRFVIDG